MEQLACDSLPMDETVPSPERLMLEGLRRGDAEASHQFFREYYPRVYRYLCWLTHHPETAEDLAQETFLRAWRFLDRFDGRGPLRVWLHRIAHREFLRHLRSRRDQTSLEETSELAAPGAQAWMDRVELGDVLEKLPAEERQVVLLHYLEGYACEEIAEIVRAPSGTVKYRLSMARARLRAHLRFLAELTPAQQQDAMGPMGLPFAKLSLSQQQRFIALALRFDDKPLASLAELEGAGAPREAWSRVDYTQPGGFVWRPPAANWYEWTVPVAPGRDGRRAILPPCRGQSPEEALAAARRLDRHLLEAIFPEASRLRPEVKTAATVPDAGSITPTRLDLSVIYVPGLSNRRNISIVNLGADMHLDTW